MQSCRGVGMWNACLQLKPNSLSVRGIEWEVDKLGQQTRETQNFEFWMDEGEMLIVGYITLASCYPDKFLN